MGLESCYQDRKHTVLVLRMDLESCYQGRKHTVLVLRLEASVIPLGGIESYMDKTFPDEAGIGK